MSQDIGDFQPQYWRVPIFTYLEYLYLFLGTLFVRQHFLHVYLKKPKNKIQISKLK